MVEDIILNVLCFCSHLGQCAVRPVILGLAWRERRGSLCAVLIAFVVLKERLATKQVCIMFAISFCVNDPFLADLNA